jgi:Polyketide cyclase / dehydrase and lipid transport
MADTYRRHALIEAPIDDVWSIVSDPHTHPDWWPELRDVRVPKEGSKKGEYTRVTRRFGFLDMVDTVWVAEPMEHLKEVNFRCTVTGSYMKCALTPAQDDTFVEIEGGVDPIGVRGRLAKTMGPMFFTRWIGDLLEALPEAVARMKQRS